MFDPLLIDQQYRTLQQVLQLYSGRRIRLQRLVEFFEPLEGDEGRRFISAYLPDLQTSFSRLILDTNFVGTPVAFLKRLERTVHGIEVSMSDRTSVEEWRAVGMKVTKARTNAETWSTEEERVDGRVELGSEVSVRIPLVEREHFSTALAPTFGVVGKLRLVSVWGGKTAGDHVYVGHFGKSDGSETSELAPVLKAAKSLAARIMQRIAIPAVQVSCSLDRTELMQGASIEACIAVGVVCGILRLSDYKDEYALRPDVAITGRVDESGRLLPVDETGLRVKIEACLFSPMRVLVVAKEQEEAGRRVIREIRLAGASHDEADGTGLDVVGASTLEEVFNNRLLTSSRVVPRYRRLALKFWKLRRPVAAAVIIGMTLALARLVYGPLDKNPTRVGFEGRRLLIHNAAGQVVYSIDVGNRTVTDAMPSTRRYAVLLDTDADDKPEVICAIARDSIGSGEYSIGCWSLSARRFLWRTAVADSTRFPLHSSGEHILYNVNQVSGGDFDRDGIPEVWVNAFSTSFSDIIMKLDATNGHVLGKYIHIGHLNSMEPVDLDEDGITEIVACGINNAYDRACVLVLDPRSMAGFGPARGNYVPDGILPAHHQVYMLVSRTIVGESFEGRQRSNRAISVSPPTKGGWRIRVAVHDVDLLDKSCFSVECAFYYLDFDRSMRPSNMVTGDDYHILARSLVKMGKIPFDPSSDRTYHQQFFASFEYWDGKGWTKRGPD